MVWDPIKKVLFDVLLYVISRNMMPKCSAKLVPFKEKFADEIKKRIRINEFRKGISNGIKEIKLYIDFMPYIEFPIKIENLSNFDITVKKMKLSIIHGDIPIGFIDADFDNQIKISGTNYFNPRYIPNPLLYKSDRKLWDIEGTIGFECKFGYFEDDYLLHYSLTEDSRVDWTNCIEGLYPCLSATKAP